MNLKLFAINIFFLLFSYHFLVAKENEPRFEHLTIEDGLSENSVISIFQDSRGFMWFGTHKVGVSKLTSYTSQFKHYHRDPAKSTTLSDNFITTIYEDQNDYLWIGSIREDKQGNLWIATYGGGFNRFQHDPGNPQSIDNNQVLDIINFQGKLWLGLRGGGLNRYEYQTGKITHYLPNPDEPNSISNNIVRQVYIDRVVTGCR